MKFPTVLFLVLVGAAWAGGPACADVGFGPPVVASVPYNSRLTDVLGTVVVTDDPGAVIDATITARITGPGGDLATLGPYPVHATGRPQRVPMPLPAEAAAALARIEHDVPHGAGKVLYTVVVPAAGDVPAATYTMSSPIILHAPAHPTRPTRIDAGMCLFDGGNGESVMGAIALPTPRAWPRTSADDARLATFGPVDAGPGCGAHLLAQPVLTAVRDPAAFVAGVGGPSDTVRSGRWFRLRASAREDPVPTATAVAVRRVAPRRYAGVRIDVRFDPECPPAAARAASLDDGLVRAVRGVALRLRIVPARR